MLLLVGHTFTLGKTSDSLRPSQRPEQAEVLSTVAGLAMLCWAHVVSVSSGHKPLSGLVPPVTIVVLLRIFYIMFEGSSFSWSAVGPSRTARYTL
mmetsp:Transcript_45035/g.119432  ORF Transcript_45035/g.119432 Transcript_45035/m.119432 type:complete len:95 (-) Transcript_45035:343-627(-)